MAQPSENREEIQRELQFLSDQITEEQERLAPLLTRQSALKKDLWYLTRQVNTLRGSRLFDGLKESLQKHAAGNPLWVAMVVICTAAILAGPIFIMTHAMGYSLNWSLALAVIAVLFSTTFLLACFQGRVSMTKIQYREAIDDSRKRIKTIESELASLRRGIDECSKKISSLNERQRSIET